MLTDKQISALRASFPAEALSADTSWGFELTSIKAAYVVECLNEVFGPCGCGWRYIQDGEAWSWPIFSPGGRRPGKGTAPLTDARKGAITDGLTKAASMIGVGHEVFKGLLRAGDKEQRPARQTEQPKAMPTNGLPARPVAPTNGHPKPAPAMPRRADVEIGTGSENGKANGASAKPSQGDAGTGHPNGKTNGTSTKPSHGDAGTGFRNGGNGLVALAQESTATTFWMLANQHAGQLERASVSALAKEVVTGKMSWLEAQTILHDMIEAASAPVFSTVVREPAIVATAKDPLDELFA